MLLGGRCRNRTYTSGFGDRCSTTKLIALGREYNTTSPFGLVAVLFFDLLVLGMHFAPFTVLFEFDLCCNQFFVFTRPIVNACTFTTSEAYKLILRHRGDYTRFLPYWQI
ncbi:MAG: hypothetical protein JWO50_556 [Candidatus Kaiserbacteria bacterium]|nr:hypothetical protein [Candidatus Kaiserbacteria bacterium]